MVLLRGAKIWHKGWILVLFGCWEGFWNMSTCFQMFVDVFEAIRGAKNEIKQKMSFFSPIPLLKSSISKNEKCRAKTLTFLWFQCIFLTYWVSKMGKPLVPVAPTHLGHLGHPIATVFSIVWGKTAFPIRYLNGLYEILNSTQTVFSQWQ